MARRSVEVRRLIDAALEAAIVPSFTKIGYGIRSRLYDWKPLASYDLTGETIVLTGGTSGLGRAAANEFASMGATLVLVARDPDKTERAREEIAIGSGNDRVSSVIADLTDLAAVRTASQQIVESHDRVHALIHNAGALFDERRTTGDGTEMTTQLMVAAPFLMTAMLVPSLRAAGPGRVITMSSGGMYTSGLTVSGLQMAEDEYNGPQQYARAKRAQVALSEMWAERFDAEEIVFHALHPGWADTPGVDDALPGFGRALGPLLRSPTQGSDTMVWLAAEPDIERRSGEFWHDRRVRSTHKLASTRRTDTPASRAALWAWCEAHTGAVVDG